MRFKIGDKARVRQWDDLVKEFGVDDDNDVKSNVIFTNGSMREFCGKLVTIKDIDTFDDSYLIKEEISWYSDQVFEKESQ